MKPQKVALYLSTRYDYKLLYVFMLYFYRCAIKCQDRITEKKREKTTHHDTPRGCNANWALIDIHTCLDGK